MKKFNLLKRKKIEKKVKKFWEWFLTKENELFDFKQNQESLFNDLQFHLDSIHNHLGFVFNEELTNGKREFIISANGDRNMIPYVETIFEDAPELDRWIMKKYKPRMEGISKFEIDNLTINPEDINFILFAEEKKIHAVFYVKGYEDEGKKSILRAGLASIIDHLVGEYDAMTKISASYIEPFDEPLPVEGKKYPIEFLPQGLDNFYEKQQRKS